MPGRSNSPRTPSPKSGRTGKITDFFKSVHQSEAKQPAKRELEVEDQDAQPAKKLKQSDDKQAGTVKTARYQIDANTPKIRKPTSARLLDDTDGGLRDSLVGRWDFEERSAEDDGPVEDKRPRSSVPAQGPVSVNNHKRKRPTSSRLLDEADGGLLESLGGRFETPRYEEEPEPSRAGGEKKDDEPAHDTLDDDSEAETIKAYDSEDDMSSVENRDNEYSDEDSDEGEDSEGDDSDKENVDPRDRYRTPSLPPIPTTPGNHGNQSHETGDATPSNQPLASPSSFLLPSPVVDLPPVSSPPSSSSTLGPEHPSTLPSPPSSP